MLWFAVWTTLVLATLAGAALLGIGLWRKSKAVLRELETTSRALDALQDRMAQLEAAQQPDAPIRPALLADDAERAHWRAVRQTNLAARRARREARHARAFRRWHDIVG